MRTTRSIAGIAYRDSSRSSHHPGSGSDSTGRVRRHIVGLRTPWFSVGPYESSPDTIMWFDVCSHFGALEFNGTPVADADSVDGVLVPEFGVYIGEPPFLRVAGAGGVVVDVLVSLESG